MAVLDPLVPDAVDYPVLSPLRRVAYLPSDVPPGPEAAAQMQAEQEQLGIPHSELGRGAVSGTHILASDLGNFVGADNFADEQARLAALNAPTVQSLDQIKGPGSALRYLVGTGTRGVVSVAPLLAAGIGAAPEVALGRATLAGIPQFSGSIVGERRATGQPEDRASALGYGALESLLGSVVPAAAGAAGQGIVKSALENAAIGVPLAAINEEATGVPADFKEAAAQGAILGGALGLPGALRPHIDTAHMQQLARQGVDFAKQKVEQAKSSEILGNLKRAYDSGAATTQDFLREAGRGIPLVDEARQLLKGDEPIAEAVANGADPEQALAQHETTQRKVAEQLHERLKEENPEAAAQFDGQDLGDHLQELASTYLDNLDVGEHVMPAVRSMAKTARSVAPKDESGGSKSLVGERVSPETTQLLLDNMSDQGLNNKNLVRRAPEIARSLLEIVRNADRYSLKELRDMADKLDYLQLGFKDTTDLINQFHQHAGGDGTLGTRIQDSLPATKDASRPGSFFQRAMDPEWAQHMSAGTLKQYARLIDEMTGPKVNDKVFRKAMELLKPAFGGEAGVRQVMDYYHTGEPNESPHGLDFEDNQNLTGNADEDVPEFSQTERPLSRADRVGTYEKHIKGKARQGESRRPVPLHEYVAAEGHDPEEFISKLEKQATNRAASAQRGVEETYKALQELNRQTNPTKNKIGVSDPELAQKIQDQKTYNEKHLASKKSAQEDLKVIQAYREGKPVTIINGRTFFATPKELMESKSLREADKARLRRLEKERIPEGENLVSINGQDVSYGTKAVLDRYDVIHTTHTDTARGEVASDADIKSYQGINPSTVKDPTAKEAAKGTGFTLTTKDGRKMYLSAESIVKSRKKSRPAGFWGPDAVADKRAFMDGLASVLARDDIAPPSAEELQRISGAVLNRKSGAVVGHDVLTRWASRKQLETTQKKLAALTPEQRAKAATAIDQMARNARETLTHYEQLDSASARESMRINVRESLLALLRGDKEAKEGAVKRGYELLKDMYQHEIDSSGDTPDEDHLLDMLREIDQTVDQVNEDVRRVEDALKNKDNLHEVGFLENRLKQVKMQRGLLKPLNEVRASMREHLQTENAEETHIARPEELGYDQDEQGEAADMLFGAKDKEKARYAEEGTSFGGPAIPVGEMGNKRGSQVLVGNARRPEGMARASQEPSSEPLPKTARDALDPVRAREREEKLTAEQKKILGEVVGDTLKRVPKSKEEKDAAEASGFQENAEGAWVTRKDVSYSMMAFKIHRDLGEEGIPAAHNSPHKFPEFDWRKNLGRGQGVQAFGAGTYLSTSEGVHQSYKDEFGARIPPQSPEQSRVLKELTRLEELINNSFVRDDRRFFHEKYTYLEGPTEEAVEAQVKEFIAAKKARLAEYAEMARTGKNKDGVPVNMDYVTKEGPAQIREMLADLEAPIMDSKKILEFALKERERYRKEYESLERPFTEKEPPTYNVTIKAKPEELMDWDEAMPFQPDRVEQAAKDFLQDGYDESLTGEDFYKRLVSELGSQTAASDWLQENGIVGHRYNANGGQESMHPNYVIYDDSRIKQNYVHFNKEGSALPEGGANADPQKLIDEIRRQRGPDIGVIADKYSELGFAGSHEIDADGNELIKIAIDSVDPEGVAHHESMHSLFKTMGRDKTGRAVKQELLDATKGAMVLNQMKERLADFPEALKQLDNGEERLAYAYQFYKRDPSFKLGPRTTGIFEKISNFLAEVVGAITGGGKLLSQRERVERIFDLLHSGDLADRNTVSRVLSSRSLDTVSHRMRRLAEPVFKLGERFAQSSTARLRGFNSEELNKVADMFQQDAEHEGAGLGFLQRKDMMRAKFVNKFMDAVKGSTDEQRKQALRNLQVPGAQPSSPLEHALVNLTKEMSDYLLEAKVMKRTKVEEKASDGTTKTSHKWEMWKPLDGYTVPRVWDPDAIASNRDGFKKALQNAGYRGDIEQLIARIADDGAFDLYNVGSDPSPFAAATMERKFDFINAANAKEFIPFMSDDLTQTMKSYIDQATRKAEHARTFGGDGGKIDRALEIAKEKEGLTQEEINEAARIIHGMDGTEQADMNPHLRKLYTGLMTYTNMVKLPFILLNSLVDPLGISLRTGEMADAWTAYKDGVKGIVRSFKNDADPTGMTELARTHGVIDDLNGIETMSRVGDAKSWSQGLKTANQHFFKWNGMEGWNRGLRVSAFGAGMRFLARHANGVNEHSSRFLKELGVEPGDIRELPDGRIATSVQDGLTPEQAEKINLALVKFVDSVIIKPTAGHNPAWGNDPHFMLLYHMKPFTFAFTNTILRRVKHEMANANGLPAMALLAYAPVQFSADLIRTGLTGQLGDMDLMSRMTAAVTRSGLGGTSEMLTRPLTELGEPGIPGLSLAGPDVNTLLDMAKIAITGQGDILRDIPGGQVAEAAGRLI